MNQVQLIGRLTKDPEVRYTTNTNLAIANFSLAISNGKDKNGNEMVDYPQIRCFGKTAELVEKFLVKGRQIGVVGRIATGSYEKDGVKHYTTYVVADRIEFLGSKAEGKPKEEEVQEDVFSFAKITDEDIPF